MWRWQQLGAALRRSPTPAALVDTGLLGHSPEIADIAITASPERDLEFEPDLLAGVAEADITPPPGMPKAGYSLNGRDGESAATPLRARIIYLRHGKTAMVLVQTDLHSGSAVVHRLVAERIHATTDVPLSGLMMGATHTHGGPGGYASSEFYSRFASNRPGFDPEYTEHLVSQIASAVERAYQTRGPAVAAWGKTEVEGYSVNRAGNPSGVNPVLNLLRVDSRKGSHTQPLGALAVFSVHGTAIGEDTTQYNGDLWAYLSASAEKQIAEAEGHRCVVAGIQGTHADVAPALRPGQDDFTEARRIGEGIGDAVARLHRDLGRRLSSTPALGVGLRDVQMTAQRRMPAPAIGAPVLGGAHGRGTPLAAIFPFTPDTPRHKVRRDGQGVKHVAFGSRLQRLLVPQREFPQWAPFQALKVGSTMMLALPFEITVELGRKIRQQALDATARLGISDVVVTSVANDYLGYATTRGEYGHQTYEGGHTLWGPGEGEFISNQCATIAREVAQSEHVLDTPRQRTFRLSVQRFSKKRAPGPPQTGLGKS